MELFPNKVLLLLLFLLPNKELLPKRELLLLALFPNKELVVLLLLLLNKPPLFMFCRLLPNEILTVFVLLLLFPNKPPPVLFPNKSFA